MSQQAANARYSGNQKTEQAAETAKMGLTVDEAKEILNVSELKPEEIEKNYQHLFAVNDKAKGGSFYLQSKVSVDLSEVRPDNEMLKIQVVRAKERLDTEVKLAQHKQGPDNPS